MESPGRVLIIVENLPVPFDRRVWQEATTLHRAGYEVSVICPVGRGYEKGREIIGGITIYRHPLPVEGSGWFGYLLEYTVSLAYEFILAWQVFLTRGFDVIHACNPPDDIFLIGAFFRAVFGKKFVFDHHDINPEFYRAKFKGTGFLYKVVLLLERLTFRLADISIATNESYRQIALERGHMPAQKVFVVRSGPDLDHLKIIAPVDGLKKGRRFLVGYLGVMGKPEGIDCLLQAVHQIVYECGREDVQFCLVGGGTELAAMKAYAATLGVTAYVTFTGRVPDHQLLEVLNTADVCVNPDLVNEMNDKSTMNKIMEYMALGKPIVQFDMVEGRVSAQQASLYAAPNDVRDFARKILQLLDDQDLRRQMGEIGRQRVINELSWEHEAPKLLRAYSELFGGAGREQAGA